MIVKACRLLSAMHNWPLRTNLMVKLGKLSHHCQSVSDLQFRNWGSHLQPTPFQAPSAQQLCLPTAYQFVLASGRKRAEDCRVSSWGFSLHESRGCPFCLTHVQADLQYWHVLDSDRWS